LKLKGFNAICCFCILDYIWKGKGNQPLCYVLSILWLTVSHAYFALHENLHKVQNF
jgi:hypothetical protein